LALTAVDYPPMHDPASFNLDAVKCQVEKMIKEHAGAVRATSSSRSQGHISVLTSVGT
jgi:hypothetical protein